MFIILGQQLVKHVISRCSIANSVDDIVITALDAVHWTKNAWKAVTQTTICNTFRKAGFANRTTQSDTGIAIINDNDDDVATAVQDLDALLTHITIGGQSLTADEFIQIDSEIPVFNEWSDVDGNLVVIDADPKENIATDNSDDDNIPPE